MCAIFGSKSLNMFCELADLNKHRGGYSSSVMCFDSKWNLIQSLQKYSTFETVKDFLLKDAYYYIGHIQSPTDGVGGVNQIHPAHVGSKYLFHNGQIKSRSIEVGVWDTYWMLEQLMGGHETDYNKALNDMDGSFACVYIDVELNTINLFTNQTCALYMNGLNLSSTKIDNKYHRLIPNTVYKLEYEKITKESEFDNMDRTYFISKKEQ